MVDAREDEQLFSTGAAVALWGLAAVLVAGVLGVMVLGGGAADVALPTVVMGLAAVVGLVVYFVPTWVAHRRGAPDFAMVAVINVVFGFTLIGWGVALALAFRDPRP